MAVAGESQKRRRKNKKRLNEKNKRSPRSRGEEKKLKRKE